MNFPFLFNVVKSFWGVRNSLRCQLGDLSEIFSEEDLPLRIETSRCITKEVTYSIELDSNGWFEKGDFYFEDIKIYTKKGFLVWEELWNIYEEEEYKFFKLLNSHKNTKGIVIGAHDGSYGEWVTLLDNPNNEFLLIEPTDAQYEKLQSTLGKKNNVKLSKSIVSCEGGEIDFYEENTGFFNSTNKSHLENFFLPESFTVVKKNSISMVELLEQNFPNQLDWIHMDTESYDAQLILSLREKKHLLPRVILFESNHLKINERYELEEFLDEEGYSINQYKDNTIAFR